MNGYRTQDGGYALVMTKEELTQARKHIGEHPPGVDGIGSRMFKVLKPMDNGEVLDVIDDCPDSEVSAPAEPDFEVNWS